MAKRYKASARIRQLFLNIHLFLPDKKKLSAQWTQLLSSYCNCYKTNTTPLVTRVGLLPHLRKVCTMQELKFPTDLSYHQVFWVSVFATFISYTFFFVTWDQVRSVIHDDTFSTGLGGNTEIRSVSRKRFKAMPFFEDPNIWSRIYAYVPNDSGVIDCKGHRERSSEVMWGNR